MTTGDDTIVRRYADALERRGEQILLRRQTGVSNNPPSLVNPVFAADTAAGETTITIDADQAAGTIIPGDRLKFGAAEPIAVTNTVHSRMSLDQPGFDGLTLASPTLIAYPAGTAIVPLWRADELVWAYVQSFATALQRDQRHGGDWFVDIGAYRVPEPMLIDELVIDGFARQIISVDRRRQRAQVVAWTIHAR